MENSTKEQSRQSLYLRDRGELNLDGVVDVKSFDDMLICLETCMGNMNVEGKGLRIIKFIMQTGEISISGVIDAVIFFDAEKEKKGIFSKFAR